MKIISTKDVSSKDKIVRVYKVNRYENGHDWEIGKFLSRADASKVIAILEKVPTAYSPHELPIYGTKEDHTYMDDDTVACFVKRGIVLEILPDLKDSPPEPAPGKSKVPSK